MNKPRKVTVIDLVTGEPRTVYEFKTLWQMTVTARHHVEDGIKAWDRLKHSVSQNYNDWITAAEAIEIGQTECMRLAETDKPQGSTYRRIFAEWLRQFQFDDMDKADRLRALDILANRAEIEQWRADEISRDIRLKLNHPTAVLRRFKAWKASQTTNAEPTR